MAVPADKSRRGLGRPGIDQEADLRDEFNKLVTQFRAAMVKIDVLTAKLNADAGVTDVNYETDFNATLAAADAASPAKVLPI